jgi:anti-sigma factor RsiW
MMSEHLSQNQLAGYSGRTLEPQELLAVDGHLASCDVCHKRLTGVLADVAKPALTPSLEFHEEPFHLDYDQYLEPYVDGKANDIDREIVDSHVAFCSRCADELKDLLAFKQQPVAAPTGAPAVTSSRWKQWLPQWPLLSNPALATAVVIAILVLTMAVVLWTKYPASPQIEQASDKQIHEQPSPAPTEQTAEKNLPSNQPEKNGTALPAPPGDQPLVVLNDAGGHVTVNQRGRLEGLHELPPDLRESVEQALATRTLRASPALTGWPSGAGSLRSGLETRSTFAPLGPTDVVLETDRPTFRWRALDGATDYTVTIYDARLRQVATSGPVTGTEWTTPNSLARGVTYSWQISALKDGKRVVSPKPPLPEARFRILDQSAVVTLVRLKGTVGRSHLAMGVFYWKHGLIEQAEREFQALAKANPNSPIARELLASLHKKF